MPAGSNAMRDAFDREVFRDHHDVQRDVEPVGAAVCEQVELRCVGEDRLRDERESPLKAGLAELRGDDRCVVAVRHRVVRPGARCRDASMEAGGMRSMIGVPLARKTVPW